MALESSLLKQIRRLNRKHGLIAADDRILVACSGGKDSWAMLHLLRAYEVIVPFSFSIVAVTIDQGQPGFDADALRDHYRAHRFEHRVVHEDTYSVVKAKTPPQKTYCSLCSRMRRGILHRVANELGCNKIALGHHREDAVQTLLLNMMFAGSIRGMAPLLAAVDDGHAVIRPVLGCREGDLSAYTARIGAPVIACNLCGSQPHARRQVIKQMLARLEHDHPGVIDNLWASIGNVRLDGPPVSDALRVLETTTRRASCTGTDDLLAP
jgi:tRNA 2-thiocytidine biosynthesis protein TtcA